MIKLNTLKLKKRTLRRAAKDFVWALYMQNYLKQNDYRKELINQVISFAQDVIKEHYENKKGGQNESKTRKRSISN